MHETIFTNHNEFGGSFLKEFNHQLNISDSLLIASGYFGTSTIIELEEKILKLSKKGICKILIGMIFFDGVTEAQKKALTSLDEKLRKINPNNGVFISMRPYHGKIYQFHHDDNVNLYLGSSNFSKEGFAGRLECTTIILDDETKQSVSDYLKELFALKTTITLAKTDLKVKGKKPTFGKISKLLKDYECPAHEYPDRSMALGECKIKLRVDDQPQSSLNLYFDKGRLSKGKYTPRPWYEVEITTTKEDQRCPYYPKSELIPGSKKSRKGLFTAYIKDGDLYYKIKMAVHADDGKNFSSQKESGGRETLGKLLKGKLERAGVLSEGELITSDILEAYGRDYVSFVKMSDDVYILEF